MKIHQSSLFAILFYTGCSFQIGQIPGKPIGKVFSTSSMKEKREAQQISAQKLAETLEEKKELLQTAQAEFEQASLLAESAPLAYQESNAFHQLAKGKYQVAKTYLEVAQAFQRSAVLTEKQEMLQKAEQVFALAKAEEEIAKSRINFSKAELLLAKHELKHAPVRLEIKRIQYEMFEMELIQNRIAKPSLSSKIQNQQQKIEKKYTKGEYQYENLQAKRDVAEIQYQNTLERVTRSLPISQEQQLAFETRILYPGVLLTSFSDEEINEQISPVEAVEISEDVLKEEKALMTSPEKHVKTPDDTIAIPTESNAQKEKVFIKEATVETGEVKETNVETKASHNEPTGIISKPDSASVEENEVPPLPEDQTKQVVPQSETLSSAPTPLQTQTSKPSPGSNLVPQANSEKTKDGATQMIIIQQDSPVSITEPVPPGKSSTPALAGDVPAEKSTAAPRTEKTTPIKKMLKKSAKKPTKKTVAEKQPNSMPAKEKPAKKKEATSEKSPSTENKSEKSSEQ